MATMVTRSACRPCHHCPRSPHMSPPVTPLRGGEEVNRGLGARVNGTSSTGGVPFRFSAVSAERRFSAAATSVCLPRCLHRHPVMAGFSAPMNDQSPPSSAATTRCVVCSKHLFHRPTGRPASHRSPEGDSGAHTVACFVTSRRHAHASRRHAMSQHVNHHLIFDAR